MPVGATIVWFRQDLRLEDNPALSAAVERGGPVLPVFVWAPEEEGAWPPGGASRWWQHHSLASLASELEALGSRLILRRGATLKVLAELIRDSRATAVFWNRRYEPHAIARDTEAKLVLRGSGVLAESFNAGLLFEPSDLAGKSGRPVQVFTAFWKRCLMSAEPPPPLAPPRRLARPVKWPSSLPLGAIELEPRIDWAAGFRLVWRPGSSGAHARLGAFLHEAVAAYAEDRNHPASEGVSRLSPHLHFGEISPRRIWHDVEREAALTDRPGSARGAEAYLRQLVWREFASHLLFHFPHTVTRPLREEFAAFPWREDAHALRAWQRGLTGYPLVDAGMRQLWQTGWMHNRVRLVAASFLVKHLLVPWQRGAEWFWDTLVDADLANNTLGWQWTAGSGADAAPYFRIFNPVVQGEKLDPEGAYVRRWLPELERLPARWVHRPWDAPPGILKDAGVKIGKTYPAPIVDHGAARARALAAFARVRRMPGRGVPRLLASRA
jgi:deoxyribodipyrimidine photo-lyase